MLHLIPQPKRLIEKNTFLTKKTILADLTNTDQRLKKQICKLPLDENGIPFYIEYGTGEREGYTLSVNDTEITLTADGIRGAFYGIQTLRQIFAHEDIPVCEIEDEPDLGYRGFYHDVTRGKIPTLETLKWLVDQMAYCKLNSLQLYVEHTYEFKEYAEVTARTGCLTAAEIRELDAYCKENFIDFIPSLATFGHLYELLELPQYKHLTEIENHVVDQIFWKDRMEHHTIDPTNPESFSLVKSLIDQYMPLFSSEWFNICCDETFDLKNGRHKDEDTGKLYVDFAKKIIEYVRSCGKKVMMWGDILHQHPERISEIPEDVLLLHWDYGANPDIDRAARFAKMNRTQIVCPGTRTWPYFCEDITNALSNIAQMADAAYKFGARGLLNTNWGDYGNTCSLSLTMCGIFFGAAKSWNISTKQESFLHDFEVLVYGFEGGSAHLWELSEIETKISFMQLCRRYSNHLYEKQLECLQPTPETIRSAHTRCLSLMDALTAETWREDSYREALLLAAEAVLVMTEIYANITGTEVTKHSNVETWLKKYRTAWLSQNKEPELCEIEKLFRFYA